ncbi:MAG: hypothetical protein Q8Q09_28895 [Deltaproteobacteria bacterium]|nr:hypothetical protein [Deltaproteobacteria bacterium]
MNDDPQDPSKSPDATATDELKASFDHLLKAARKAAQSAEPAANKAASSVNEAIDRLNRGGEQVAVEVGKQVATLAERLAQRLEALAKKAAPSQSDDSSKQDE